MEEVAKTDERTEGRRLSMMNPVVVVVVVVVNDNRLRKTMKFHECGYGWLRWQVHLDPKTFLHDYTHGHDRKKE